MVQLIQIVRCNKIKFIKIFYNDAPFFFVNLRYFCVPTTCAELKHLFFMGTVVEERDHTDNISNTHIFAQV